MTLRDQHTPILAQPDDATQALLHAAAAAYGVPLRCVQPLVRVPTARNPHALSVRASTGRWGAWGETTLTAGDPAPTFPDIDGLLVADLGTKPHLALVPVLRYWSLVLAVQAWDAGLLDLGDYPRVGWYSPADAVAARHEAPSLRDVGLRAKLRRACWAYRQLHPKGEACACEAQIAAALGPR